MTSVPTVPVSVPPVPPKPDPFWSPILNNGAWLYAALVFIGFVELHSYYTAFGVQIWTYMSMGELMMTFLSLSGLMMMFLVAGIVQLWAMRDFAFRKEAQKPPRNPTRSGVLFWDYFRLILAMLTLFSAMEQMSYLTYGSHFYVSDSVFWFLVYMVMILIVFITLAALNESLTHRYTGIYMAVAIGYGILLMCSVNRKDAEAIKRDNSIMEVTIRTETDTLTTDASVVYIGRCNAATFLYDRRDSTTLVIPNDEIISARTKGVKKKP